MLKNTDFCPRLPAEIVAKDRTSKGASKLLPMTQRVSVASAAASAGLTISDVLKEEVGHELVMLPYYSVFDWMEASVKPDGSVILSGQVVRPTTKGDAEARVKKLEGATQVVNNIEVLPLSTNDDRLRIAAYRAIFGYSSPLFRYGMQAVPPIHIIVKNGRLSLKGIVATPMDSQLAYTAVRQVPGIFEVNNELIVERPAES
jgi:hyperosmotically inducible protein